MLFVDRLHLDFVIAIVTIDARREKHGAEETPSLKRKRVLSLISFSALAFNIWKLLTVDI